jgi:hypothetical protein
MAATTRFVAAISTLSVLLLPAVSASPSYNTPVYSACKPTTATVSVTVTVPYGGNPSATSVDPQKGNAPPSTLSSSGVVFPTYTSKPNPNGPYYNPYDYVSAPFTWPGKPTKGQTTVPPRPTPKYNYGGDMSWKYIPGCWVPKGSDLTPALPQSDTNGNSPWGLPECPHLSSYLGPAGGSGSVKASTSSSTKGPLKTITTSLGRPTSFTTISGKPSGTVSSLSFKPTGSVSGLPVSSSGPFGNGTISTSSATNGTLTNSTSAACGKMPDTGVTRKYTFSVSQIQIAPDGVQKNGIVINGGFPGPLIEANCKLFFVYDQYTI